MARECAALFCLEVGSGTGVPRCPTTRLFVLIGVASPPVPFGLSSSISKDPIHPPRAYGDRGRTGLTSPLPSRLPHF